MTVAPSPFHRVVAFIAGALALSTSAVRAQSLGFGPPAPLNSNAYNIGGAHQNPVAAAVGGNAWVAAWDSDSTLDHTLGRDHDILFARSSDGGVSWSFPEPLNSDAANDAGLEDGRPALAFDDGGRGVAAWIRFNGATAELLVATSSDAGVSWSPPRRPSELPEAHPSGVSNVAVARGGEGVFVAAWRAANGPASSRHLYASRSADYGETWSDPSPLVAPGGDDLSIVDSRLALQSDRLGRWIALWEREAGFGIPPLFFNSRREIGCSISGDDGASWGAGGALHELAQGSDGSLHQRPALATDREGHWIAAWNEGANRRMARSLDNGLTWIAGPDLAETREEDDADRGLCDFQVYYEARDNPVLAMDGFGSGILFSTLRRSGQQCCYNGFGYSCFYTTYVTPQRGLLFNGGQSGVLSQDIVAYSSAVAFDEEANVWLAIEQHAPSKSLRVRRSIDKGAQWGGIAILNIDGLDQERPGQDSAISVAADGAGSMVALWESDEPVESMNGDFNILQASSTDNGATWSDARAAFPHQIAFSGADRHPVVVSPGRGVFAAAWSAQGVFSPTQQSDVYFAFSSDGGANWDVGTKLSANAQSNAIELVPALATDREGVWIAAWASSTLLPDADAGDLGDIQFARSIDDAATWSAPMTLGAAGVFDFRPAIAAGSGDVWVAVWNSGGDYGDVAVARSDDDGATWSAQAPVSRRGGTPEGVPEIGGPAVATDRAGRWVVAWPSATRAGGPLGADLDILFVNSADDGQSWTESAPLHWDATIDGGPEEWDDEAVSLAFAPDGSCVATWRKVVYGSNGRGLVAVARSLDGGATWSSTGTASGVFANGANPGFVNPVAVAGANGRWLVAWPSGDDPNDDVLDDLDLFYAYSDALQQTETLGAKGFAVR